MAGFQADEDHAAEVGPKMSGPWFGTCPRRAGTTGRVGGRCRKPLIDGLSSPNPHRMEGEPR